MIVLIFVFPIFISSSESSWVLKLKKFCPHLGSDSQPRVQHFDGQSQVLHHSAILAPLL